MKNNVSKLISTIFLTLFLLIFSPAAGVFAADTPIITISTPSANLVTNQDFVDIKGYVSNVATLDIDNVRVPVSYNGYFAYKKQPLVNGANNIVLIAMNSAGQSVRKTLTVVYDPTAQNPTIVITKQADGEAADGATVTTPTIDLNCSVNDIDSLSYRINGKDSITVPGGPFGAGIVPVSINLDPGDNNVIFTVTKGTKVVNHPIHIVFSSGLPKIIAVKPASGDQVTTKTVQFSGIVLNTDSLKMFVNNDPAGTSVQINPDGSFITESVNLNLGDNTVKFVATRGETDDSKIVNIRYEPIIVISSPQNNDLVTRDSVTITGRVFNTEANGLTINDEPVSFGTDGTFYKSIELDKIKNTIKVKAANGNLVNTTDLTIYFSGIPRIDIDYPVSGDSVNTADVVFKGSIFPTGDQITGFTIEGADGPIDNRSTISGSTFLSLPVTLEAGKSTDVVFTLTTDAIATPTGVLPARSVTRTITVNSNVGPVITVASPEDGATVYSNTVTVHGRLQRADVNSLKVDGISTKVDSDGTFSQTVTLPKGKKAIKIEAKLVGTKDITTTKTITVYYDAIATQSAVVRTLMTDGGEVKAFNDMIKVKLSKGSVGLNTTSVLAVADQDDCENLPAQSALIGPIISVGWNGDGPINTYRITLKYDEVVRDNQAHKVSVFHYDPGAEKWTVLGGIVDTRAKTVTVETNRTGYFTPAIYFKTFDDLPKHWGQKDIEYLVARGAIPLNTTHQFQPDVYITRAEFVMFLVKALGIQRYRPSVASYDDVEYNSDYYEYIETALRAGLVSGISHDKFAPAQHLTREEAAVILARAGNMKTLKDPDIVKLLSKFSDEKNISTWARNQLAAAVKGKVLNGLADNTLRPQGKTTRAEAAAMIVRLSEHLN